MSFLHPLLFAAGAGAIAIPIVIHFLFRRRRKPIVWAAMRFLMEAYKKHQRRLKLEQLLLLAARCLVLLLVALALGRPIAESASAALGLSGGRTVYIVLDNSLASSLRDSAGAGETALERHRRAAAALVDSLGAGDRAALVTLGSPAREIVLPASADLSAVAALIKAIEPTDARADWAGAVSAIGRAITDRGDERGRRTVALYSDFRAGSADLSRPLPAALEEAPRTRLLASAPASASVGNVQIVTIEPLRRVALARDTAGAMDVRVRLRRTGVAVGVDDTTSVRLALARTLGATVEGARGVVRWSPGQSEAEVIVSLGSGAPTDDRAAALVAWIDRDALDRDNRSARPVVVRRAIRVGVAARPRFGPLPGADALEPADWLRLALAPTESAPIEVTDVDPAAIDTPTLARLDALFVPRPDLLQDDGWRRVGAFARAGGVVVVSPPPGLNVHLWSDALARSLGMPWRIARESVDFTEPMRLAVEPGRAGLLELIASELPALARSVMVNRALPVIAGAEDSTTPITLDDGSPWLLFAAPGEAEPDSSGRGASATVSRGLVVYLASAPALTWTNLPARPLFVPLMQELVRQGVGEASGAGAVRAGSRPVAPTRTAELVGLDDGARVAVGPTGVALEPIRSATLLSAVDSAGLERGLIAVNPDPDAGRTEVQPPEAVRAWLASAGVEPDSIEWLESENGVSAGPVAAGADEGSGLAWWLLLGAAVVAIAEAVMARLFSHASVAPTRLRRASA